jgi:predicted acetylornithine/succinylornithine family transaminase
VYYTAPATELCAQLCRHSFAERVFLCNSGAEANEAAMKLARRWGADAGGGRYEILSTQGSFHGRTFATLTATGQEKYQRGFQPLLPGVRLVPFDDLAAMDAAVRDETVAIMVEPIQGEGGVRVPRLDYLPGLRALADRRNLLLLFDEVQCGMGRTGKLFAYEHAGVTPDAMALAKALGGGIPIGALCTTERLAAVLTPGSHGTTFGGNPVACAAATAALQSLADTALLDNVHALGEHFRARLEAIAPRAGIREVRGMGLMIGAELERPGAPIVERCLADGLLINCTAERVLRFVPPLVIRRGQIDEGFAILERALLQ